MICYFNNLLPLHVWGAFKGSNSEVPGEQLQIGAFILPFAQITQFYESSKHLEHLELHALFF
jgi:hypothetical protein